MSSLRQLQEVPQRKIVLLVSPPGTLPHRVSAPWKAALGEAYAGKPSEHPQGLSRDGFSRSGGREVSNGVGNGGSQGREVDR